MLTAFYQHTKPIVETSIQDAAKQNNAFRPIDGYFRPLIPANLFNVILGR
jgi:hypothetical protein